MNDEKLQSNTHFLKSIFSLWTCGRLHGSQFFPPSPPLSTFYVSILKIEIISFVHKVGLKSDFNLVIPKASFWRKIKSVSQKLFQFELSCKLYDFYLFYIYNFDPEVDASYHLSFSKITIWLNYLKSLFY